MSNPPFGSPLYSEEDDFSFPFQPPNDEPIINYPPLIQDQTSLPSTSTSSSIPMSDFQDLSMFLGDDHEQDYTLIGQYDSNILIHDTINWASPIEQADVGLGHGQMPQQGGSDAHGLVLQQSGGDAHQHCYPVTTTTTTTTTTIDEQAVGGGGEGSSSKKLDHNAKEKERRMKLNETYLTLRSLLPDSKRAKKRWSAPYLIDKSLDYIPQLQAEVEKLTVEKSSMLSVLEKKQQQLVLSSDGLNNVNKDNKTLTVSMNEVKSGEIIIQICEDNKKAGVLSNLIERLEGLGFFILGASSQRACEDRSCFHLHVQMGENPVEADYVAVLHKKIIFWLS
nr:hypothetical protein [Suaeda aralocaspica]